VTSADLAYVALALTPGIGRSRLDSLLARFQYPVDVLRASQTDLESVPGIGRAAATALRHASLARAARLVRRATELGGCVLTPSDVGFPAVLQEIPEPPTLLFATGDVELFQRPAVAIVGSRSHTRYGAEVCRHFAAGCARAGLVVVSGMARGIDALAHAAALDAGGGSVGVLGNGLGVTYPAANRALYERMATHGALLTEFPPGERPRVGSFPRRNRLVSGLARATLVIEAREKSGALVTVDAALSQGREVLAVPGPITSPVSVGCNRLIQHGAKPALGLRDVLEEYGIALEDAPGARLPNDLTDDERRVLAALDVEDLHVDRVAEALEADPAVVLATLTSLEIRGLVRRDPGPVFGRHG
jgi:DNA processing protein